MKLLEATKALVEEKIDSKKRREIDDLGSCLTMSSCGRVIGMTGKRTRYLELLLLVAVLLCHSACSRPINSDGYNHGYKRAKNDFLFRTKVYPPGHGYQPAAEIKFRKAYLYEGYPSEGLGDQYWATPNYRDDWITGYEDYCISQGYKVIVVSYKAPNYGKL